MSDKAIKIALIGTQRVGKTSLLSKFHFGTFDDNTVTTVGASFIIHNFNQESTSHPFQIWDTAGQEKYRSLGPIYYRNAVCAISVFDLTNPESLEELKIYINLFKENCPNYIHIAIVGNKADLYKTCGGVDILEVKEWVADEGYSFHKTSALTGEGVRETFEDVAQIVMSKREKSPTNSNEINAKNKKGGCC